MRGLAYMHEQRVIHRDLKSVCLFPTHAVEMGANNDDQDNVLISPDRRALICDLGCARLSFASRSRGEPNSSAKGTMHYWAPELIDEHAHMQAIRMTARR